MQVVTKNHEKYILKNCFELTIARVGMPSANWGGAANMKGFAPCRRPLKLDA